MGYDPDHPMAEGEVGKVGVSIASIDDMDQLLAGIPLDKVTTSMTINATATILLAFYIAVAKRQGLNPNVLSGTIQNDILKEYIARGTYIYPPRPSLRLITDLFAYAQREVPQWNTISISGYHMREAGATAVQELAFTLPTAETAQVALRTQQVLAYESGVADVVDPLAGSYYVESLTDEIERRAWEYIERIDQRGGALAAVEAGYIQSEIQEAAYEYQRQVERGERIIVGTNRFKSSETEPTIEILTVDPSVRERQCERLRALRARRDNERCRHALQRLQAAARNDRENLLPLIVEPVEAYCTLGESSDTFRTE